MQAINSFLDLDLCYYIVSKATGKVIDLDGTTAANNGGKIQQWEKLEGNNQKWKLEEAGDGYYYIVSKATGKVIDLDGTTAANNGGKIQQWEKLGGNNQKWKLEGAGDGYYYIVSKATGKVIDLDGTTEANNGGKIQQWEKLEGNNQKWKLEAIADDQPARKSQIVVLSDIHIGTNAPTVWYQKSFHESYLVAALDWVKSNAESIQELILLGDVVDFWTYPAEEVPPSFDAIMAANSNIFGPNGKLSQVLTALNGKVTYVRGNHDMSITQADLDKIQNPNGYKIKLSPDDIYYPLGNANKRIACTHGHIYAMFNAPYNNSSSPIAPLPVGHFVSRAVASKRKKELQPGQSVAQLNDSGDPGMWETIPSFAKILLEALPPNLALAVAAVVSGRTAAAWDALSSVAKLLLTTMANVTGLGNTQPIKLPNGKIITIGEAKQIYDNLFSDWRNKNDFLTAYKAVMADWKSLYMGWFAQKFAFEVGADLVVMGHTHTPISGLSDSLIQYVNSGFNCPSVPDIGKKHPTFVTINVDNLHTDVMQVFKEGNSYNIKPGNAQRDSVVVTPTQDFSCYVVIDNQQEKSELRRKDFKAEHGHYIVPPPAIIKPGEIVRFWLQDYPGTYGAEGWVKYTKQDNQQEITFKYGCPLVSSNYCSGTNFYTKSANSDWGNLNEVRTSGHPFFVKWNLKGIKSRIFIHAPNGDWSKSHEDTIINYVTWGGTNWTAKVEGNTFIHAPNGDWSKSHEDTIINYVTWGGTNWTAKVEGNIFIHAPNGDWSKSHKDTIINYVTWGGTNWTAKFK